jgi:hypothetical protein
LPAEAEVTRKIKRISARHRDMKIFLPNLVQVSKNQVATNSPCLAWASNAAMAAILATSVELAATRSRSLFDNSAK